MERKCHMERVKEVLRAAQRKIAKPEAWCKGRFATDAKGEDIASRSTDAASWCMRGAICAVSSSDHDATCARELLERVTGARNLAHWNDDPGRTHAEVLAAFDRAAEMAEGEGEGQ